MKRILFLPTLFFAISSFCQCRTSKNPQMDFMEMVNSDGLKKDLSVLAGPEMEGRETGMPGQMKAAAYIESRMKEIGLKPLPGMKGGYQQYYLLLRDSMIKASCSIGEIEWKYGEDFIMPVGQNSNTSVHADQIKFVGYGINDEKYSDYVQGVNYHNCILLMISGEPKSNGRYMITGTDKPGEWTSSGLKLKLEAAKKAGAAAVILMNTQQEQIPNRSVEYSKKSSRFIVDAHQAEKAGYIQISHQAARRIFNQEWIDSIISQAKSLEAFAGTAFYNRLQENSKMMDISIELKKHTDSVRPSNVLGMIEGKKYKNEYVFVTAHYDHLGIHEGKIYYGADDDGSGTAAVLQLASVFAKAKAAGKGPERSMVFMTVSGEEKGLLGSEYYSEHPLLPLEKTSADLNIDMIGRIDTERKSADTNNYVYVIGHDKISTELGAICEKSNSASTQISLDYKFDDPKDPNRIYFRSDHYNFARKGVPVLFFYDGMLLGDYHKPTDTIEKINWEVYAKRARMIFATAWQVANSDHMMLRDLPIPTMTR